MRTEEHMRLAARLDLERKHQGLSHPPAGPGTEQHPGSAVHKSAMAKGQAGTSDCGSTLPALAGTGTAAQPGTAEEEGGSQIPA